jgi:hypothetical protein
MEKMKSKISTAFTEGAVKSAQTWQALYKLCLLKF